MLERNQSAYAHFRQEVHTKDQFDEYWDKSEERYDEYLREGVFWGSELASMAFAVYLVVWGVYRENPSYFHFFSWASTKLASLLNAKADSLATSIWIVILVSASLLWLFAIRLKHLHHAHIASFKTREKVSWLSRKWFQQYAYLIYGNFVGIAVLLSAVWIITYA